MRDHPGAGDQVMHSNVCIGETTLMASDGQCEGQPNFEGFSLSLTAPNEAEADRLFAALADGGQVQLPLAKTFFFPRFGMVADRFGVPWMADRERPVLGNHGPMIYHGVVRSVATVPGREVTQNARLFMAVTQATDDALIAVFDAKYHYNFWRSVTAIRNGDIDSNDATERDPSWTPFIDTAMHPEYRCAHCIVSATVGTVLQAEIGNRSHADLDDDESDRQRRGANLDVDPLCAGSGKCANLRRRALPQLDRSRHRHGQTNWRVGSGQLPTAPK